MQRLQWVYEASQEPEGPVSQARVNPSAACNNRSRGDVDKYGCPSFGGSCSHQRGGKEAGASTLASFFCPTSISPHSVWGPDSGGENRVKLLQVLVALLRCALVQRGLD